MRGSTKITTTKQQQRNEYENKLSREMTANGAIAFRKRSQKRHVKYIRDSKSCTFKKSH